MFNRINNLVYFITGNSQLHCYDLDRIEDSNARTTVLEYVRCFDLDKTCVAAVLNKDEVYSLHIKLLDRDGKLAPITPESPTVVNLEAGFKYNTMTVYKQAVIIGGYDAKKSRSLTLFDKRTRKPTHKHCLKEEIGKTIEI